MQRLFKLHQIKPKKNNTKKILRFLTVSLSLYSIKKGVLSSAEERPLLNLNIYDTQKETDIILNEKSIQKIKDQILDFYYTRNFEEAIILADYCFKNTDDIKTKKKMFLILIDL